MKKITVFLFVMGMLSILSGCKEDKPTEVSQTVDWYKTHKIERAEALTKCRENPGELMTSTTCTNASRADSATTWSAKGGGINTPKPLTADQINKR